MPSPDPLHPYRERRVVSLVIDFDDGAREILDFMPDNLAFYRDRGVQRRVEGTTKMEVYKLTEIWWTENPPKGATDDSP